VNKVNNNKVLTSIVESNSQTLLSVI